MWYWRISVIANIENKQTFERLKNSFCYRQISIAGGSVKAGFNCSFPTCVHFPTILPQIRLVAIKVYKKEFTSVLTQELATNRRLARNDPFKWACLVNIKDTFQVGDIESQESDPNVYHCAVMELMDPKPLFVHSSFVRMKELRYDKETPFR